MKEDISDITKEALLLDGWAETGDSVVIMEKKVENINPINRTPEYRDIKLVIHRYFNYPAFAVMFPDGGMLNFVAHSMKDLKFFEERITFYDCPY